MKPTMPVVVGFLRGLLESIVIGGIGGFVVWIEAVNAGEWNIVIPAIVLAARTVEGFADQRIDPTKQRGRLGGSNAS